MNGVPSRVVPCDARGPPSGGGVPALQHHQGPGFLLCFCLSPALSSVLRVTRWLLMLTSVLEGRRRRRAGEQNGHLSHQLKAPAGEILCISTHGIHSFYFIGHPSLQQRRGNAFFYLSVLWPQIQRALKLRKKLAMRGQGKAPTIANSKNTGHFHTQFQFQPLLPAWKIWWCSLLHSHVAMTGQSWVETACFILFSVF